MKVKRFIARNKLILVLLGILLLFFIYYLYLHRYPRTDNAFVVANIRPVSAFVPGHLTEIFVNNNQTVKKGDKLFQVYQVPYKLKVDELQNELKAQEFTVVGLDEQLKVDDLGIKEKEALFANKEYLANQATKLSVVHAVAEKNAEILVKELDVAKSELLIAQTKRNITNQKLQTAKANVSRLKAELEAAKVNLDLTTVYSSSNGIVSNMFLTTGTYANQGEPLFSFINTEKWWIQANLKETELTNVKEGQKVWIKLWLYPNEIFEGVIANIGWNVNRQLTASRNYLPEVVKENEWFLLPQRFPVQILISNHDPKKYPLHVGASATVVIDTPDSLWRHIFWQIDWW